MTDSGTGEGRHRIADCRPHQRRRHLSHPGRMIVGHHHVDMDLRHVAISHDGVVVEVRLLHRAVRDRDPLGQRHAETVDDAALGLRDHVIGLYRNALIDRAPEIVDANLSGLAVDRYFRDTRDLRAGIVDIRKAKTEIDESLKQDLDRLLDPATRGDPMSPLRWTCKSTPKLAAELRPLGMTLFD